MTTGGRKTSGILAIVGGAISLIPSVGLMLCIITSSILSESIISLICSILGSIFGVLGFVGGILFLTEKQPGGLLPIITGGAGGFAMSVILIVLPPSIPSWNFILTFLVPTFSVIFIISQSIVVSAGIVGIIDYSKGKEDNSI